MTSNLGMVTIRGRKKYRTARLRRPTRERLKVGYRTYADELRTSRQFTPRDQELLEIIYSVGLLSRFQIQRLLWGDSVKSTTVSTRLRQLYQHWVLNITTDVSFEMEKEGLEPCHVYTLGPVGEEILAIDQHQKRGELGYNRRYASGRSEQNIMHDVMTAEVFVQATVFAYEYEKQLVERMKRQGLSGDELRREVIRQRLTVTWFGEHVSSIWQGDNELVRPDGTLAIEQDQQRQLYFVELDRGATEWEKKVNLYDNARQFGAWQSQFGANEYPAVLVVAPARRSRRIAQVISWHKPTVRYLIQEWPDFLENGITNGWQDVTNGQRPISLVDCR